MWPRGYFPGRYFPPDFWPSGLGEAYPTITIGVDSYVTWPTVTLKPVTSVRLDEPVEVTLEGD